MIVGCGKVGMTLVDRLSKEGHDISVVDKNAARLQSVTHMHDVYGVVGNGASFTVLKEAGIENTDILISVTDSDELNLLCCLVENVPDTARSLPECVRRIIVRKKHI